MYYSGFSVLIHKARFVYYYENGKEYKEKMNLPISNESYNTALEYVKDKQLKEVNFMQYVSDLHDKSMTHLNEIIQIDTSNE